jgi:hypothetical protein
MEPVASKSETGLSQKQNMEKEIEQKLETLIHQELRKLPARRAPASLAPRVLAAIHAREQQASWQRPWIAWPFKVRLIFGSAAMISAALFVFFGFEFLSGNLSKASDSFAFLSPLWEVLWALGQATLLLVRSINQALLLAVFAVIFLMYLACLAIGTACFRVAFHKI